MTNARWALSLISLAVLMQQVHSINGGAHSPLLKRQTRQRDSNCTSSDPQQHKGCHLNLTTTTTTTTTPAPKTTSTRKLGLITRTSDAIYKTLSDLFKPDRDQDHELMSLVTPIMPAGGHHEEFGRRNASKLTSPTSSTTKSPSKIARSQQPHIELDLFRDEPMTTKLPVFKSTTTTTTRKANAIKSTSTTAAPKTASTTSSAPTTTASTSTSTRKETNVDRITTTKEPHILSEKILDQKENKQTIQQQETKLVGIINSALNSIYSLSEFTYLNRTTRLAHGHESIDIQTGGQDGETEEAKDLGKLIALESSQTQIDNQNQNNNNSKQFATREDIHLLCKLLHKQLENGLLLPNGNLNLINNRTTNDQQATTTSKPPTIIKSVIEQPVESQPNKPPPGFFIINLNELNEAQESRLLESTFALNKSRNLPGQSFNESHEETSQRLLLDLFNFAYKIRQNSSRGESLETSDDDNVLYSNSSSNDHFLGLKLWSKSIYGGKGGRLRLVYWLIEPIFRNLTRGDGGRGPMELYKFKVVDSSEANELLDLLDHSLIKRQLDSIHLVPVGGLVRPHKAASSLAGQQEADDEANLNVIDDNLVPVGNSNEQPPQASKKSGLQRLADRLTNQSFADNLYLYLLIFLMLLFLLVLCCFGCPIFCFKREQSPQDLDQLRQSISSISGGLKSSGSPTLQQQQQQQQHQKQLAKSKRDQQEEQLKQASDAIWRKLSNSTTTLVKDQTRVLRHDGSIEVPILKERANQTSDEHLVDNLQASTSGGGQFEWYSFEDHRSEQIQRRRRPARGSNGDQGGHHTSDKQSQTFIISDRRQLTKSVQTYPEAPDGALVDQSSDQSTRLMMSCRDRHEAKSSDTLTKSELIMLKEKLIPIEGAQVRPTSGSGKQQVASQTSLQRPDDYVNMTTQTGPSIDDQQPPPPPPVARSPNYVEQRATRYIDSSSSSSDRPSTVIEQLMGQQPQAGASCSLGATTTASGSKLTSIGTNQPAHQSMDLEREAIEREQLERRPKMRHLELPQKYGSKVEAIKSELNKLEQRDPGSTGTYKRYDII